MFFKKYYCFILGSRDVINGEEYSPEFEGYDGPRDPNRPRPKKHKTKKSQRSACEVYKEF